MKALVRSSVTALFATAALALPAGASAAPASKVFAISGNEYAFTSTVGSFAGIGLGNAGDRAVWNTSVQHDPLGSVPTHVRGGSFEMATLSPTGHVDRVAGTFVYHGGTIMPLSSTGSLPCPNQRFQVTGALHDVATRTSSGGLGGFSVVLTHYRIPLFGHCVIYNARVLGTVSFTY